MRRFAFMLALLALLYWPAAAQEEARTREQEKMAAAELEAEVTEFFHRFDHDKDARVTLAEVRKSAGADVKEHEAALELGDTYCLVLAADADDDGLLTRAEYHALRTRRNTEKSWRPPLSRADVEALKKEIFAPIITWLFEGADSDKDGRFTIEEYAAAAGSDTAFKEADADGNGFLTRAELEDEWLDELAGKFALPADGEPVFSKAGRTWLHRITTKQGGTETVAFRRVEIAAANGKEATLRTQALDAARKPVGEPDESKAAIAPAFRSATRESVIVPAGKFVCDVHEEAGGKRWEAAQYPGLVVKQTAENGALTELIEFKP